MNLVVITILNMLRSLLAASSGQFWCAGKLENMEHSHLIFFAHLQNRLLYHGLNLI